MNHRPHRILAVAMACLLLVALLPLGALAAQATVVTAFDHDVENLVVSGNWAETARGAVTIPEGVSSAQDRGHLTYYTSYGAARSTFFQWITVSSSNPSVLTATARHVGSGEMLVEFTALAQGSATITITYPANERFINGSGVGYPGTQDYYPDGEIVYNVNVTGDPNPATPTPDPATPTPDPATPTPDPATPTPDPATPTPDPATPTPDPATPTPDPATPTPDPATPDPATPTPDPSASADPSQSAPPSADPDASADPSATSSLMPLPSDGGSGSGTGSGDDAGSGGGSDSGNGSDTPHTGDDPLPGLLMALLAAGSAAALLALLRPRRAHR